MKPSPAFSANDHVRQLVDSVPSMLAYWGSDWRCRFANRAYERWFGADPDQLIGTHIEDLLGPDLFAENKSYMLAALDGQPQVFERQVRVVDGHVRHSLVHYVPDVVAGEVLGVIVQVTEVTQLKDLEAALEREHALRARVEQQLAELDRLLRERTEMLDILAHEIRQPLGNASAALQIARSVLRRVSDTFVSEQICRAEGVLGQVIASMDNTLAAASLLARNEPIQRDDADVDTFVSVTIADLPAGDRRRVNVRKETATRTASMDMSLMRLALRNVLSNALKFAPAQTPVDLRIADSDAPLALVIEVRDEGPGIPPEVLPRLFERGQRGSAPRSGQGLGLYIAKVVLGLHHGSIELVQSGASGTVIRLTIAQAVDG